MHHLHRATLILLCVASFMDYSVSALCERSCICLMLNESAFGVLALPSYSVNHNESGHNLLVQFWAG